MAKKTVKRYQAGGPTASANIPVPASIPKFTAPSQPGFSGGQTASGPPYFPNYSPPNELASSNKPFKKGGKVRSASKRADGCACKGKTRAR